MGSPAGDKNFLEIIQVTDDEKENERSPPTPTNQPRTVLDISWDSNKKGHILNVIIMSLSHINTGCPQKTAIRVQSSFYGVKCP